MTPAEFEAGVQRWHESDSPLDIWEFLGISREEYARMVTKPDLVEVVRCADCAKSRIVPWDNGTTINLCSINGTQHKLDHFCSYGDRFISGREFLEAMGSDVFEDVESLVESIEEP